MNCCTDYGQCQQGHGCPVRAARMTGAAGVLGEHTDGDEAHSTRSALLHAALWAAVASAFCAAAGLVAGVATGLGLI